MAVHFHTYPRADVQTNIDVGSQKPGLVVGLYQVIPRKEGEEDEEDEEEEKEDEEKEDEKEKEIYNEEEDM